MTAPGILPERAKKLGKAESTCTFGTNEMRRMNPPATSLPAAEQRPGCYRAGAGHQRLLQ
jgi:hypothetical protein